MHTETENWLICQWMRQSPLDPPPVKPSVEIDRLVRAMCGTLAGTDGILPEGFYPQEIRPVTARRFICTAVNMERKQTWSFIIGKDALVRKKYEGVSCATTIATFDQRPVDRAPHPHILTIPFYNWAPLRIRDVYGTLHVGRITSIRRESGVLRFLLHRPNTECDAAGYARILTYDAQAQAWHISRVRLP